MTITVDAVFTGGVLRHPSSRLRESILARVPDAEPVYPTLEPVAGAVLLAADQAGARPSLDRLRSDNGSTRLRVGHDDLRDLGIGQRRPDLRYPGVRHRDGLRLMARELPCFEPRKSRADQLRSFWVAA